MSATTDLQTRKALSRAKKLAARGKLAEAAELCDGVLSAQPHHAEAKKQLARLAKQRKKDNDGGKVGGGEAGAQPTPQQLAPLASLYRSGQLARAETAARQLASAFPRALPVLNVLGAALLGQGKVDAALKQFRRCTEIAPDDPDTHANLASALHRSGRPEQALESVDRAIALRPDHAASRLHRGNLLIDLNRSDEALADFERVLALAPGSAEAHFCYANTLADLDRPDEALEYYDRCVELAPAQVEARVNRANTLKRLGRRDDAVADLRRAIELDPARPEASINLGFIRTAEGRCAEAVELLQPHLERNPGNREALSCLVGALNYCDGESALGGRHARLQGELRRLEPARIGGGRITDEDIAGLYRECRALKDASGLPLERYAQTQVWRGEAHYQGCDRHFVVFNTFGAIPRYCFDCYKVYVEPRNVVELLKLLVVFATIELPGDLTRKCMIEVREGISGAYKGYVYCRGLDEAREIERIVGEVVGERISPETRVTVKRGCSEYAQSHPAFGRLPDRDDDAMTYPEEWAAREAEADAGLTRHIYPPTTGSYNHDGLTLHDVLAIDNWLAYAAAIGDDSYRQLTGRPVAPLDLPRHRAFGRAAFGRAADGRAADGG